MQFGTIQKTVLLVDDNRFVVELYADAFRNAGFDTDVAIGAAEALKKIRSEKVYDAIVVDVIMVAVDGLELIEKIKQEGLSQKSVFIVLTNAVEPDKIDKAKELGVAMYLTKVSTVPVEAVRQVTQALEARPRI